MIDLIQLKKEKVQISKQINRSKTLFALIAAHSLDMALISSHSVKNPATLEEAQRTSDMINYFYQENTSAFDFIKPVEDSVNKTIDNYNVFKSAIQKCPFEKQVLEGFCKYYSNTGWDISMWKCQINYIIYIGLAIQEHYLGNVTQDQLQESIDCVAKSGQKFFSFKPQWILRSFAEANNKLIEIEQKIQTRKIK